MDITVLNTILEKHRKWVNNEEGGEKADLCGADLRDAKLSKANLSGANLSGANLSRANLCEANLSEVDLWRANLSGANLYGANLWEATLFGATLRGADLYGANLHGANLCEATLFGATLRGADLYGANLRRADLSMANLYGANLCEATLFGANLRGANLCEATLYEAKLRGADNIPYIPMACPDTGSFVAWKKAGKYIIKLFIPEDAMRLSATGRKCRANKAKVLEIQNVDGEKANISSVESDYNSSFIYVVGQEITVPDFEENRFIECASGIHFFINRQDAVNY